VLTRGLPWAPPEFAPTIAILLLRQAPEESTDRRAQ